MFYHVIHQIPLSILPALRLGEFVPEPPPPATSTSRLHDLTASRLRNFTANNDEVGEKYSIAKMSDGAEQTAEQNIEIWKVKKLIKRLEAARGNGTSMISLIIRTF